MSTSFQHPPQGDYSFTRTQANRLRQLTEAQNVLAWIVLVSVIGMVGTLLMLQASETALKGREVWQMEANLQDIYRENERLRDQIARGQSSERMRFEAEKLGFIVPELDTVEFITVENYPAQIPEVMIAEEAVSPTPVTIREALSIMFSSWINVFTEGEAR